MIIVKYGEKNGYGIYSIWKDQYCGYVWDALFNSCNNIIVNKDWIIKVFNRKNHLNKLFDEEWGSGIGEFYRFTKDGVLFYFIGNNIQDPSCDVTVAYYFTYYNFKKKKTISSILRENYIWLKPKDPKYNFNCDGPVWWKDRKLTSSSLKFYDADKSYFSKEINIKAKTTEEAFYKTLIVDTLPIGSSWKVVPAVSFRWWKVNQRFDIATKTWKTHPVSPDPMDGASIAMDSPNGAFDLQWVLTYCRYFYPQTKSVKQLKNGVITHRMTEGNTWDPYTSTKPVRECRQ